MIWNFETILVNIFPRPAYIKHPRYLEMNMPIWIGSPNFFKGRNNHVPMAIVVHIMDGTLTGTDAWFLDSASSLSAHYGIGKDGTVHHYVHECDTAFHAGIVHSPTWNLYDPSINPNSVTVGIEHEGRSADVWPDAQKHASAQLIAEIAHRWNIPLDRQHVIGHRELDTVTRSFCPSGDGSIVDELLALALTCV